MESRGVPTLMVHTEPFKTLAESTLAYRHYGYVPRFELPRRFEHMSEADVRTLADEHAQEIVRSLLG